MNIVASDSVSVGPTAAAWREILRRADRHPVELARRLALPPDWIAGAERAAADFRLFVPEPYLARIEPGNPDDPLLRQVWPDPRELADADGFTRDPLNETAAVESAGVLRKYAGRALLVTSGACGIHCRYCFRRHFPYSESPSSLEQWQPALRRIADDPSVREVLLSGGDPLTWTDPRLGQLIEALAAIPHLRRLRIHTRMPIAIPQRVTAELIAAIRRGGLTTVIVVHANHPREIDPLVAARLRMLGDQGWTLLNQSVLLAGVNDRWEALAELSERLADCGVLPYYLHQLDRVAGSRHLEVSIDHGRQLIERLRRELPGYLVPRYVREEPGASAKVPLA